LAYNTLKKRIEASLIKKIGNIVTLFSIIVFGKFGISANNQMAKNIKAFAKNRFSFLSKLEVQFGRA